MRHDFSHWIFAIFGDHDLAMKVERIERTHIGEINVSDFAETLSEEIEQRYRY